MVFSSSIFLLYFLPIFLLAYFFIDAKYKNILILIASIFFYSWGAPKFVFVILISTIIDFYIVKKIHKTNVLKTRKILLASSIFINVGLLAYFKYANFFIENVNTALHSLGANEIAWTSVVLPIGISFYTFQTLTYSIDIYRKKHAPLEKVTDYLLYIMSFPQMIAGPIVRFSTIADQITNRKETVDSRLIGFYRFAIGLAKKVLIANVMAEQADLIFNSNLSVLNTPNAWIGILAYTFQIYFDFSGYSDMAIGLGKMMGFTFPENFNSPYISKNISEFWRRWHITLGSFMKDYLYIPLGGNRVDSKYRLFFNLWLVFLLSGLWHGASWNYIIWGAYHGLFLILDRIFLVKILTKLGSFIATAFTFIVVMVGWVIFRLEDMSNVVIYLQKMFSFEFITDINILSDFKLILIFAVIFAFLSATKFGKKMENYFFNKSLYSIKEHAFIFVLTAILFTISLAFITTSGFNPFIYFRF